MGNQEDAMTDRTSPLPWRDAGRSGAIVHDGHVKACYNPKHWTNTVRAEDGTYCAELTEYYGGHPVLESCNEADRRRIIACIMACKYFTTEALEHIVREDKDLDLALIAAVAFGKDLLFRRH